MVAAEDESEEESEEEESEEGETDDDEDSEDDRVRSPLGDAHYDYRATKAVRSESKTGGLPPPMMEKEEPGVEGGDFRTKLRQAGTKINTRAAFPEAKAKGEQVDFRTVLKKSTGPEKKRFRSEQQDFRGSLKRKVGVWHGAWLLCTCMWPIAMW